MIIRLVSPGDVIIAGDDIYGGTDRLLTFTKTNGGADVRHIDMTNQEQLDAVLQECGTKVKMVLIESPTNPMLKVLDIKRIADSVHGASPVSTATSRYINLADMFVTGLVDRCGQYHDVTIPTKAFEPRRRHYLRFGYQVSQWTPRCYGRYHRRRARGSRQGKLFRSSVP